LEKRGLYFDTQWRDLGDFFWVMEMVKQNIPRSVLDVRTSVFYETGDNMNLKPNAVRESGVRDSMRPGWVRKSEHLFLFAHRLRMIKSGAFWVKPYDISLYTPASPKERVTQHIAKPTTLWPGRRG
jgi:hypothetical protein